MDPYRYREVIENYSLVKDIEMLPFSDLTGIRERDVNLSCGQKQRVQLARALYQDANGYLLDDPFSTVDAHSATSLFNLWPRICNGSSIKQDNYDNTWENDTNGGKEGALTKDVIPQVFVIKMVPLRNISANVPYNKYYNFSLLVALK
uniref:ABC transporter domain-containing protein n=1 Tax=Vitis vinifera TaxID=29760 RepID=A5AZJ4_VITVI|nr:hypothetical protein VITISV_009542 [Vitis vinifera]